MSGSAQPRRGLKRITLFLLLMVPGLSQANEAYDQFKQQNEQQRQQQQEAQRQQEQQQRQQFEDDFKRQQQRVEEQNRHHQAILEGLEKESRERQLHEKDKR